MAKAFLIPKVTTTKVEGFSLEEMRKRLAQGPNVVRVGLPDSTNAVAHPGANTAASPAVRPPRTRRKGRRT